MNRFNLRAWDKKKKELFPVHELQWHKISNEPEKIVGYDDWDKDGYTYHGGGNMSYAREDRYILEQCTGVNDKNGTPIYDGDILKIYSDEEYTTAIYWSEANAGYCFKNLYGVEESFAEIMSCDLGRPVNCGEVVGNIHENPEILETA